MDNIDHLTSTNLSSRSVITAASDFIFDSQSDIVYNIIENILRLNCTSGISKDGIAAACQWFLKKTLLFFPTN